MNKRIVSALVLAGMIASSSAFASNARNAVMGQGGANNFSNGGSFYYEDAYNFFYNPAYVNDYKNWAIFEKGSSATGNTDGASFGFVTSMMNFNLGLFFNRNAALTTGTNATDLMIGGDMGVKWGLGLTYGSDATSGAAGFNKSSDLSMRLGVSVAGLDPFISFKLIGKDKLDSTDVTKYSDMAIGARYHYGEWTPYAAYRARSTKTSASGAEVKTNNLTVGVGRETKLAEGARLAYAVYWENSKVENTPTAAATDRKTNNVPVEMSIEADALSWLTLRGGVNHVLSSDNNTQTTTARVGGTFHVSKVDVDYAFGNSPGAAGTNTASMDTGNVGFDSGTFHQVAMRYSW